MPDLGIGEAIAGLLVAGGLGAETAGVAAPFIAGGLEGAALGAGTSAVTGGDPLTGALTGGLTGGAVGGFGPALGEAAGIGTTAGDALVGAGAGAVGAGITGGNPLTGALTGGAGGAISGALGGAGGGEGAGVGTSSVTPASASGTGGSSAAAASGPAAPSPVGVSGGAPTVDLASSALGLADPSQLSGSDFLSQTAGQSAIPGQFTTAQLSDPNNVNQLLPSPGSIKTPAGGAGGTFDKLFSNPGVLLGGAALGANLLFGNQPSAAETQIQKNAGEHQTQARTDAAYQQSGTLPAGLQAVVDQQFEASKGAIVSQYASAGLGNSTQLADKMTQLKAQKSAEVAQFADSLAKQGIAIDNLSATEFGQLLQAEQARNTAFTSAISNFAKGLAGAGVASAAA